MRNQESNLSAVFSVPPATYNADPTPAAVDLQGFDSATILMPVGVGGITFDASNKVEFKLTHSDDNSTYTAVEQADVSGSVTVGAGGIIRSLVAAHAAASCAKVGYVGGKRYIKVLPDFSGTHGTGTPLAAIVLKGNPSLAPV